MIYESNSIYNKKEYNSQVTLEIRVKMFQGVDIGYVEKKKIQKNM